MNFRIHVVPLALAAVTAACAATALPIQRDHLADVQVIDRTTGARLPVYGQAGARWIAGTPGHKYAIEVRNRTGGRVLAVMSVDGVNVISGETAGFEQRGYVFAPYERYDVAGWRKSQEQIAAFEFAALPDSYAARTGRPENIGVIGIALFREKAAPIAREAPAPSERRGLPAPSAAPSAAAKSAIPVPPADSAARAEAQPQAPARLGTAHGDEENAVVSLTNFERAQSTPDEIVTIRYDRRENLVALGVLPPAPVERGADPMPFPLSDSGYVPDPPAR